MDRRRRERAGYGHEQEHEQAVIGTAARGDRHDREPLRAGLHRHVAADQRGTHRRQRIDEQAGQDSGEQAKRGEKEHRGKREASRFPCGLGGARARPAEKRHAVGFDEAGRGKRRGQREQRADGRHQELQAPWRQLRAEQDRLERQPFRDEAVERRQRRDRDAADQEDERGLRHAMDEAAEMLHVALAGRGQHGAGAEEQQALEQRMVEDVKQRRGERERRSEDHAVGLERERKAEPDEDDADVLHRVIGEQPLEIVLHERVEHAHDRRHAGEREHDDAPPPGRARRRGRTRCGRSRRPRPWS